MIPSYLASSSQKSHCTRDSSIELVKIRNQRIRDSNSSGLWDSLGISDYSDAASHRNLYLETENA